MYPNYSQYPTAYSNAYNNQFSTQFTQQPQRMDIIKVSGKNGAEAFQMAPNSSVLLLDESAPIVWLKQTDGAGYPTISPYSITPYQPEPTINTSDLEARISRLEGIVNEQSYAKSNKHTEQTSTSNATVTKNETTKTNSKDGK